MKIRYRFSDRENKATNEQTGEAGVAFTPRFQVWSSRERQADHSIRKYDIWSFKRISVNKEWHFLAIGSAFNKCNRMTLEIKCTWDMNLRCTNSNLYFVSFHVIPCYLCNVICWCTCTCCDSWAIQSFLWTNFIHTKARLFAFIFLYDLCNPTEPNSKTSKFSHRKCWEGRSLHNVQISDACLNEASILWPGKIMWALCYGVFVSTEPSSKWQTRLLAHLPLK